MLNTAAARPHIISNPTDYKAVVCILLGEVQTVLIFGTNRALRIRSIRWPQEAHWHSVILLQILLNLLPLNYNNNGRTFSVHAGLSAVQNLFNTGQLSFLTNIGTLIEPIANKTEYNSGTKKFHLVCTVILIRSCNGRHLCLKAGVPLVLPGEWPIFCRI